MTGIEYKVGKTRIEPSCLKYYIIVMRMGLELSMEIATGMAMDRTKQWKGMDGILVMCMEISWVLNWVREGRGTGVGTSMGWGLA